jgi:NDP-sugar pyrophosphorylase family protein
MFVVDDTNKLIGTLTDGDIRRGLIAGHSLDEPVSKVMHSRFRALTPGGNDFVTVREARKAGVDLLPRLDVSGRLLDIEDLRIVREMLPLDAVLMAGGKGERLRPLTLTTPKPLLKIGDKAIIDYNIDELEANGVNRIFVTVNYLKEQIIEHFNNRDGRIKIECVSEPKRMGTIGSLSLVEGLSEDNVLLMNSDLLTTLSFADMYEHHISAKADLTMAVIPYNVSVPFAILQTDGDRVTGLAEKPIYNYFANAGVYILKRELISRIDNEAFTDAPDFIADLISDNKKVSYFPINGSWIDIGSPDDFRNASELMAHRHK